MSKIIIHPSYDNSAHKYDIALVKLAVNSLKYVIKKKNAYLFWSFKRSVNLNSSSLNIATVCVPDGREYYVDRQAYATGFGKLNLKAYSHLGIMFVQGNKKSLY